VCSLGLDGCLSTAAAAANDSAPAASSASSDVLADVTDDVDEDADGDSRWLLTRRRTDRLIGRHVSVTFRDKNAAVKWFPTFFYFAAREACEVLRAACVYVCLSALISQSSHVLTSRNSSVCMLPVALARCCSDDRAERCVLLVL